MENHNGKTFFAVAYEKYKGGGIWEPNIIYTHAESTAHARNQFLCAHPNRRLIKLVAVGPAVGFFAKEEDEEGKVLRA